MASKVVEIVTPIVENVVKTFGFDLVDITYEKEHSSYVLTIFIDKEGGITIDDCENVSKALDDPLDSVDPTKGESYTLNVSSCGLDRPLKKVSDFKRNINKAVVVKTFVEINGSKLFVGTIKDVKDNELILNVDNKDIIIEYKQIAKCNLDIKF
jgi:ribosome maturation factor RimP